MKSTTKSVFVLCITILSILHSTHKCRRVFRLSTYKLIKPPRVKRLPDIVTVEKARRLFSMAHTLSYRVFFCTLYSLGLRLDEGLRLTVAHTEFLSTYKAVLPSQIKALGCAETVSNHSKPTHDGALRWL